MSRLLCRLFGHRWVNVRAWSTADDSAYFCRRCHIAQVEAYGTALVKALQERDTLAQAMWDARWHLGFDNDGDANPGARIAGGGYKKFAAAHVREAIEVRQDYDEALDESDAAEAKVRRMEALADEGYDLTRFYGDRCPTCMTQSTASVIDIHAALDRGVR